MIYVGLSSGGGETHRFFGGWFAWPWHVVLVYLQGIMCNSGWFCWRSTDIRHVFLPTANNDDD